MGTIGARHCRDIINNVRNVLATELFIGLTAVEIKGIEKLSPKTKEKFDMYRNIAPFMDKDRAFSEDINALSNELRIIK